MKKGILIFAVFSIACAFFAESYTNNEYQKRAKEYGEKAQEAFDAGDYVLSIEYSALAAENAALSQAYIRMMLVKTEADRKLRQAGRRIAWAESVNAPSRFPALFDDASYCYDSAQQYYGEEDFYAAIDYAQLAIDALRGVTEEEPAAAEAQPIPLPQYYVVRPWAESKDCFWNIAGRPYVFNDPRLWDYLYQINKDGIPVPANPDLIEPGMRILIPSIAGEVREGEYDPNVDYGVFGE
jgi:hypothetical protein